MPEGDAPDAGGGKGFKLGDAFVDVHIDADKAAKQAAKDLKKAKKDLDEAAKEIGDSAGKQAGDKLGSATVKATKDKVDKEGPALGKWIAISVFGGMPAAAQVAGTATALGLAAAGAGIIGLAALATSQNEQVQQSYNQLWATVRDGTIKAAAPLAGSISDAADQINTDLGQMTGSFQRMFKYAEPGIDDLAAGLTGLARESLPGMIAASKNSEVVMKGLGSMLTSTGKGVSEFLVNSSTAAQSSSVIMASFGRIIQNLLGFAGSFFAQLSNAGVPVAIRFEQTLKLLEGTILRLGSGAFPVLFSAAGAGMDVLSGVLGVLGQFAPVIGPATGAVLALVAAGKLLNLLSFGRLGTELGKVKTSFREADGVRGKFSAGLGVLGSGFGLAGVAAIAVTGVLGMLGQQQADAARKTQEHQGRVDALSTALRNSKGAIDSNVRSAAAAELANMKVEKTGKSVLQMSRELGLSIPLVTDAYMGNAAAQAEVKRQIDGLLPSYEEWRRINESGTDAEKKRIGHAKLLQVAFSDTNGELGQAMQKYKDLVAAESESAAATENLRGAQQRQKKSTEELKAAFQVLAEPMGDVASRGKAIADAFDRITGRQPALDEATKSWHEFMDSLKDTKFEDAAAGSRKWAEALVDTSGKINTTTKDGRALYDLVQRGRTDFDNMAAAMSAAGVPADEISNRLTTMRDGLVETIDKMGFTREEALLMAQSFGIVPKDVSILVSTGGTVSATTAEVMILGGRLKGLPPNTPVKVAALTDEAKRLLEAMGVQIRSLPNGQFEVKAGTDAAAKNLESFIWYWSRRQLNIPVVVGTPKNIPLRNMTGGMVAFAEGTDFAPGGLAVVGEKGPEIVSIPRGSKVFTNKESQQIVSGTTGSDGAVFPTGAGVGDTYNNNFYLTAPAMPDLDVLAELLSRRIEQRMRQRRGA